jgi:hypothetical protein
VQDRAAAGRQTSVYDALHDGRIIPTPLGFSEDAAVLALDARQKEFDELAALCPGGSVEKIANDKGRTLFLVYRSSEGECVASAMISIIYGR